MRGAGRDICIERNFIWLFPSWVVVVTSVRKGALLIVWDGEREGQNSQRLGVA